MADKSCENCGQYKSGECNMLKPEHTHICTNNYYQFWLPTPPPADEMQEVHNADRVHPTDKPDDVVNISNTLKLNYNPETKTIDATINPELSPELLAWARSKALDLVEIDEMKLSEVHDEYACRFLDIADIKSIYKANPLKLKTPTGGKGIND